ncbi:hypothetical protein [Flaviflagellibacter deserti]|jgi:hypothetical protein|uniref:Uncharacterized protein n=1 Tax=Flaviflagellibacter deserti TaxID=2267266 RepID=A0ABV9Z4Y1_9HYPH
MSIETAKNAAQAIVRQQDINLIAAATAKSLLDLIAEVERLQAEITELKAGK